MRILTICSDGDINISQQAQWSGYSDVAGVATERLTKDVGIFINSIAVKPAGMQESMLRTKLPETKEEKLKRLKTKIDSLLEEITLLENFT